MAKRVPQVDAAVIVRARRGERAAHAELYAVLAPMVYTLAYRMLVSRALAEDILQETFIEVITKIATYRGEADFGFWVRRIAVNKCLMHLRSGWNRRQSFADELDLVASEEAPPERHRALERALAGLSDTARAVVWLHDVEGYTHREIARMMRRTPSFSKSQLARAHERLRESLQGALEENEQLCTPVLKTC